MQKTPISQWKSTVPWQGKEKAEGYNYSVYQQSGIINAKNDVEIELVTRKCDPGQIVLDLGTGTGRFAVPLYDKGCKVTAMDNSQAMLDFCRDNVFEGRDIPLIHTDIFDGISANSNTYDRVVAITVIRHFQEWKYVLSEMLRVCKTGGKIIFENCSGDMIQEANKIAGTQKWGWNSGDRATGSYESEILYSDLKNYIQSISGTIESIEPYDIFNCNYYLRELMGPEEYEKLTGKWGGFVTDPNGREFWKFIATDILPRIMGIHTSYNYLVTVRKV